MISGIIVWQGKDLIMLTLLGVGVILYLSVYLNYKIREWLRQFKNKK